MGENHLNQKKNRKKQRKEIIWIVGTFGFSLLLTVLAFGPDGFTAADSTLDINLHDVYFVFAKFHLVSLITVIIFFFVYLFRVGIGRFMNLTANLVFLISLILVLLTLTEICSMVDSFIQSTGYTIYPPTSTINGSPEIDEEINRFQSYSRNFSNIVLTSRFLLLVLLAFTGFKTGLNFKS